MRFSNKPTCLDRSCLQLGVHSPLLRDVVLIETSVGLDDCPQPPSSTSADMTWVLREAFQRLNISDISAVAARTDMDAQYLSLLHVELCPLIKAIVRPWQNYAYRWDDYLSIFHLDATLKIP